MPEEAVEVRKVVYDVERNLHITTFIVGPSEAPPMVFIHGWGGSGLMMYKIFKPLAQNFRAIFIDLLGMGSSSRPPFECETAE